MPAPCHGLIVRAHSFFVAVCSRRWAAARDFEALVARAGLARVHQTCRSSNCTGDCLATRKAEIADPNSGRAAPRAATVAWLAVSSSRQRRHPALAYDPPAAFEEALLQRFAA